MMSKRKKEKVLVSKMLDRVTVTYVKNANAWCRTTFSTGQQVQAWSKDKPLDNTK